MNTRNDSQFRTLSEMQDVPARLETPTWKPEPELAGPIPRRVALKPEVIIPYLTLLLISVVGAILMMGESHFTISVFGLPVHRVTSPAPWQKVFVGGFFAALLIAIFAVIERGRRESKSLVECGIPARGTVVSVERRWRWRFTGLTLAGRRETRIVLAYDTPQGPMTHEVTGEITSNEKETKVGDVHTLLYLPESPENATLYKQCWYEAVAS